jgi:Rrf2 family protein
MAIPARVGHNRHVRITAKTDYAVRAMVELAAAPDDRPVKAETIAETQGIPPHFLLKILTDLRIAQLAASYRGQAGGYRLARPAESITVADIIRAVEGPLADVHGQPPEDVTYEGAATDVRTVWLATRSALRGVLEHVTLADIVAHDLPSAVTSYTKRPGAHRRR